MNEEIKQNLSLVVERIVKKIKIDKIILFGSFAYGKPNEDSDIDLCIISNENKRNIEIKHEIRKLIRGVNFPFDILVYKPDDFLNRSDSNTSLENKILSDGIVLYG